ncbi:MAG: DUF4293 domain-containing protein [Bacteroidales bacterium]|nr:DUF4293 domain-containing protein [Bacteroidales bacterium]
MIQRLQSIYLFVAFVAALLLFFFPMASFLSDMEYYKFYIYGLENMAPEAGNAYIINQWYTVPLIILGVALGFIALVTIFLYKNRLLQIKLIKIDILVNVLLIGLFFLLYMPVVEDAIGVAPEYGREIGIYLPLISLIFLILAHRGIKKDEKIVRAADRIR